MGSTPIWSTFRKFNMAKWMVSAKKADFTKLAEIFRIDPVIARIIRNRDIVDETQSVMQSNFGMRLVNKGGTEISWMKRRSIFF